MTAEQKARDMLERMGVHGAQSMTAGDLVELANLIADQAKQAAQERERCALIVAGNYGWVNGVYYDDLADAVRGLPAPDGEGPPKPGA